MLENSVITSCETTEKTSTKPNDKPIFIDLVDDSDENEDDSNSMDGSDENQIDSENDDIACPYEKCEYKFSSDRVLELHISLLHEVQIKQEDSGNDSELANDSNHDDIYNNDDESNLEPNVYQHQPTSCQTENNGNIEFNVENNRSLDQLNCENAIIKPTTTIVDNEKFENEKYSPAKNRENKNEKPNIADVGEKTDLLSPTKKFSNCEKI